MQEQKEAILEQEKAQRTQGTYQKKKPIMRSKSTFDDEPDWQLVNKCVISILISHTVLIHHEI